MDEAEATKLKRAAQDALQAGEAEQALTLLTPLVEARPSDDEALTMAGVALLAAGDGSGALAVLDRAASLTPDAPSVHYNRGRAFERLGRREEAVRAFSRTLDLEPDHAPAASRLRNLLRGPSQETVAAPTARANTSPTSGIRRRRVVKRGVSTPLQESPSDEMTLRAAQAMAQVVQRLEQLVEKVDEVSARPAPARSESQLPARSNRDVDADVWFNRPQRPLPPPLLPPRYEPYEPYVPLERFTPPPEEALPNVWQLSGGALQLFLLRPLPWMLPLLIMHGIAALSGLFFPLNMWGQVLLWSVAFAVGISPALVVLTDQWILGDTSDAPPVPFIDRVLGVGRLVLLIQVLLVIPITALLAWRANVPVPLLNSVAVMLAFPFYVLLAPAFFVSTTEDAGVGAAFRAGIELSPRRAWIHLAVMSLVLLGGGCLLAGLVFFLSRSFAGAGQGFTTLWWVFGASLGAGLWGATVITCGADAVAAAELGEVDPQAKPQFVGGT